MVLPCPAILLPREEFAPLVLPRLFILPRFVVLAPRLAVPPVVPWPAIVFGRLVFEGREAVLGRLAPVFGRLVVVVWLVFECAGVEAWLGADA
jgi:hypothetical protein